MAKRISIRYCCICLIVLFTSLTAFANNDSLKWVTIEKKEFVLHYILEDKNRINNIRNDLRSGIDHVADFFRNPFQKKFDVYIFPDRTLLDKQWQKDWNDSSFHSECWMIASGVAHRLDILSPNVWAKEACDHNANDEKEIKQVIWHELTHVYHGQFNSDHTFSYIEKLDWLVEGIATYVSGQLDEKRLQRIKQMIAENKIPSTLDNFWKGQEKYGLSGSMVAFVDKKYGRKILFELLKQTNKDDALKLLNSSESQLISDWKNSFH